MCRAHAIGWDVKSKIGTLFTLLDTVKRKKDFKNPLKEIIFMFRMHLNIRTNPIIVVPFQC